MAFWNFVIYHVSDFATLDYDGSATTNAILNPIYITIEDDDSRFGQQGSDTGMLQRISSSSDPSLVGQTIFNEVNGSMNQLTDLSSGTFRLSEVRIGFSSNWVIATLDDVNVTLDPSTTYTEPPLAPSKLGIDYATGALPCFTAGTHIQTPCGPVPIEALRVGDKIMTLDHGQQKIRWIGSRRISAAAQRHDASLRPIRIAADAMGGGLPRRDLLVSRQHRMLVRTPLAQAIFGTEEVLMPAIMLVGLPGIEIAPPQDVTYLHILCKRHEVILAEGSAMETLFLGPRMRDAARDEALRLFDGLDLEQFSPFPARLLAQGKRATRLADRMAAEARARQADLAPAAFAV